LDWLNDGAISIADQIKETLVEIGNIIKSKSESGTAYFTGQEYESVKAMCKESAKQSQEARFAFLQSVLSDQKKILRERVVRDETAEASEVETPLIATHNPDAVLPVSEPKRPESKKDEPSLSEEFQKMIQKKEVEKKVQEMVVAPIEEATEEDDGFEDDIPFNSGEAELAIAELDIF
jgi:hypothetical protein